MNILVLSQKISDLHLDIIQSALPDQSNLTVITGSILERHEFVRSPAHDPNSFASRLRCWMQYYTFVRKWAKRNRNIEFDLIFATSNPPINGTLGVRLKKIYKCKFAYMNWDLYPQVIETSIKGLIPRLFSWGWHRVNNLIYPQIDQMITIGSVMANTINEPLERKVPIEIIPMFTDTDRLKPLKRNENPFCINNNFVDKFVILYSGKMGLGHNLDILLNASKLLINEKDILFLFIGHGQKYSYIKRWIKENKADNVQIMPLQSEEIFPFSMASGCVGFISQEQKAAKCFMPAKTYDMMACGMPLIAYSEGTDDLSELVKKNNLGVVMTTDAPKELAQHIVELYSNKELYNRYSVNSRNAAVKYFNIDAVTEQYQRVFTKLLT